MKRVIVSLLVLLAVLAGYTSIGEAQWSGSAAAGGCKSNCTFTGATSFADGTAGAPSIAFSSDSTTGIYKVGATTIGFSSGGTGLMEVTTSGVFVPAGEPLGFLSGPLGTTSDVYINRQGVGILGIGQTANGATVQFGPARSYFICGKANGGTCSWNGGAGVVNTTISDSNDCLTTATSCATEAGAVAKFANEVLTSNVITMNFADTAGTGTDCYQPNAVSINQLSQGFSRGMAYNFDSTSGGGDGETDAYPTGYIYFLGNATTPANVIFTGSATCAGTTSAHIVGTYINNTHVRVNGIQVQYFGSGGTNSGAGFVLNHSLGYFENMRGLHNNANNAANAVVKARNFSSLRAGGTWNVTNMSALWATQSMIDDKTPLSCLNLTFTGNSAYGSNGLAIQVEESGKEYIDCGTYSFGGTGAYTAFSAQDGGIITFNDGAPVSITFNNANMVGMWARVYSNIELNTCSNGFNITMACTAGPATYAKATSGSLILLGGTTGKGSAVTDNIIQGGARVIIDWFGDTIAQIYGAANAGVVRMMGLGSLSKTTTLGNNIENTCAFAAGTTCAVAFGTAEPDANYDVFIDTPANIGAIWITAKGTGGFTINCVTANSSTVRWFLFRR